jgi:hypothetical protein
MTVEAEERVDQRAMHPVVRAVRRALEVTFAEPVADGRPIPSRWPAGMAVIGWTTGALVVVLGAVSVFAGVLRAHFPFLGSQATNRSIPEVLLPLFVTVVVWTLGLAHCALIRLAWYIKLPGLAVAISGMAGLALFSQGRVLVLAVAAVSYLAVIVIVFARRRAPYVWWEFPLITSLIAVSWVVILIAPGVGALIAYDTRLVGIEAQLTDFAAVAMPALIAAGVAPALITVSAAEAIAVRPVPRVLTIIGVVAVVAWRLVTTLQTVSGDPLEQGSEALLASVVTLALTALALILVWRLSPRPDVVRPGELPELWTAWSFPIAVLLTGIVVLMVPVTWLYGIWTLLHLPGEAIVSADFDAVWNAVNSSWWRAVPGAGMGIGAIVLARRGRLGEASLLAAVCVYAVSGAVGWLFPPGMVRARTPEAIATVTSWLAIALVVVLFLARRLTRQRLVGLLTVLLVGGLYTYRNALDDPVSAILGYAGLGIALFGLIWQALTGAHFTREGSRRFPEPTRIFAYLANTLFAFAIVAFVATTRVQLGLALSDLDATGDAALGTPLLIAATVLGLWYGFGAEESSD